MSSLEGLSSLRLSSGSSAWEVQAAGRGPGVEVVTLVMGPAVVVGATVVMLGVGAAAEGRLLE